MLGLRLAGGTLKFLIKFLTRGPHFHFALMPASYVVSAGLREETRCYMHAYSDL